MSNVMDRVTKMEDRYFDQMKEMEQPILDFTSEVSERAARFVPERPSFLADLPTMTEVVESQLKLQKKFVDEQMRFTRRMMKAMNPIVTRVDAQPETTKATTKK
jgi:hypothetical protein